MNQQTKAPSHKFNVILDPATYAALTAMAQSQSVARGHIIRGAIRDRYKMLFQNEPTCANGQGCLCPINHTVQQQAALQKTDPAAPADPDKRTLIQPTLPQFP